MVVGTTGKTNCRAYPGNRETVFGESASDNPGEGKRAAISRPYLFKASPDGHRTLSLCQKAPSGPLFIQVE